MYKIVTGIVCVMVVVILGTTITVSGQEAEDVMIVPMGVITLEAPEGVEAKKILGTLPTLPAFCYGVQRVPPQMGGTGKNQKLHHLRLP